MDALAQKKERQEVMAKRPTMTAIELQALVRQIVGQIADELPATIFEEHQRDDQQIILDIEVDGARYILIRTQIDDARAQIILSPREQEIARMVAEGYPNKTIAAVLDISSWTVGTYLRRIFAKFGVGSRAAMVARMLEEGMRIGQRKQPALSLQRKYPAAK